MGDIGKIMNRLTITLGLIAWVVLMTFANGINATTLVAFILALPIMGFAFYLIWFDSKKPKDQQWRYYNRRK